MSVFIFIVWFSLIVIFSLVPLNVNDIMEFKVASLDSSGFFKHAVAYFVLGLMAFAAFSRRILLWLFFFFMAGAGLELVQLFIPARSFNIYDVLSNSIGLVLAGLVIRLKTAES